MVENDMAAPWHAANWIRTSAFIQPASDERNRPGDALRIGNLA
jgi:hypothetical protein